jgi:hypothetical protein
MEVVKAGAIGVKQFAWYYTIVYRGGKDRHGNCYDVVDTTVDQLYQPERLEAHARHLAAMKATWSITLRKVRKATGKSRFILTGYRAGASVPCGSDSDGWHMYQHSMLRCGRNGLTMEQVLRRYLRPNLEIVTPGAHDIVGTELGDAAALVGDGEGHLTAHVWPIRQREIGPAGGSGPVVAAHSLQGHASVDLNGDGRDDLLLVRSRGDGEVRLIAAISDGTGYREPAEWYRGNLGAPAVPLQLLVGDFGGDDPANADGRADVGLLVPGRQAGTARLLVLLRGKGKPRFEEPRLWWRGALDLETARSWAADTNGDGRADVIASEPVGPDGSGGVRFSTAVSPRRGGPLAPMKQRFLASDLRANRLLPVIGDANRDGRDDVWLIIGGAGPVYADLLQSAGFGKPFERIRKVWQTSRRLPFGGLRAAAADIDYNGFGDVVLFENLRDDGGRQTGARLLALRAGYATLVADVAVIEPDVNGAGLRPF